MARFPKFASRCRGEDIKEWNDARDDLKPWIVQSFIPQEQ